MKSLKIYGSEGEQKNKMQKDRMVEEASRHTNVAEMRKAQHRTAMNL